MIQQRTLDWHRQRLGKFTGSKVADLMGKGRAKADEFSAAGLTYIRRVAAQRMLSPAVIDDDELLGEYLDLTSATSKAMRWGTDMEDDARELYRLVTHDKVLDVEFTAKAGLECFGASPDGIIIDANTGELGVLEIKCALDERFVEYTYVCDADSLKQIEPKYYWQMMAEMACTGYGYGRFVVYNPWMAKPLHMARIERNDDDVAEMLRKVELADMMVQSIIYS